MEQKNASRKTMASIMAAEELKLQILKQSSTHGKITGKPQTWEADVSIGELSTLPSRSMGGWYQACHS